jgi:hypothetical protein
MTVKRVGYQQAADASIMRKAIKSNTYLMSNTSVYARPSVISREVGTFVSPATIYVMMQPTSSRTKPTLVSLRDTKKMHDK